ncbi:MAG TPA: hypothetical protein VHF90_08850 [Thermoleophilaceae bacterium]|nr:hypothetical protein [Thermoleophilaceae bacterium]
MRKLSIVGAAVLGAVAAVAIGAIAQDDVQTTFTIDADVIPNKAGTPKDPRGVTIKASARFFTPQGVDPPIVTHGYALFPRNGDYNPHLYPRCDKRTLDRDGPGRCPKGSQIGAARASAYADTIITRPRIEIFNGGPKVAFAYVTLYRPALVQTAVPARIQEIPRGKWKYKVSVRVPEVLQVVAGIPIAARSFKGYVGKGNLIVTTSCPKSRRWPYEVKTFFTIGKPYKYRDSVPCRPAD